MTPIDGNVQRPFTGRHMLAVMLGFFGVVVAVNLGLAFFATHSWTGLVVENAYVASQHFNKDLEKAREQQALGWRSAMTYRGGVLHVDVRTRSGAALAGLDVSAALQRPTHEGEDRSVDLRPVPEGGYAARLAVPAGTWNATVEATDAQGRRYHRDFRLWVGEGR